MLRNRIVSSIRRRRDNLIRSSGVFLGNLYKQEDAELDNNNDMYGPIVPFEIRYNLILAFEKKQSFPQIYSKIDALELCKTLFSRNSKVSC